MALIRELKTPVEFIFTEAPGKISRDTVVVTLAAGASLRPGNLIGRVAADDDVYRNGTFTLLDLEASDGSEVIAGMVIAGAEVCVQGCELIPGEDTPDVVVVDAGLRALRIKIRDIDAATWD